MPRKPFFLVSEFLNTAGPLYAFTCSGFCEALSQSLFVEFLCLTIPSLTSTLQSKRT